MATRNPARAHGAATRWRLDAVGATLAPGRTGTMSRASLWRLLADADLTPHRRGSGLHRHAPDGEATAHGMCA